MPEKPPLSDHPWAVFLAARSGAIDWLREDHTDAEIARILSMDETQVYLIRTSTR